MIEVLNIGLPIVINILLVILLTIGIILGIKCINIIDSIKEVVLDVQEKIESVNGIFKIIDMFNSKINVVAEGIVSFAEGLVSKFIKKHKDEFDEEDELESIIEKERKR